MLLQKTSYNVEKNGSFTTHTFNWILSEIGLCRKETIWERPEKWCNLDSIVDMGQTRERRVTEQKRRNPVGKYSASQS